MSGPASVSHNNNKTMKETLSTKRNFFYSLRGNLSEFGLKERSLPWDRNCAVNHPVKAHSDKVCLMHAAAVEGCCAVNWKRFKYSAPQLSVAATCINCALSE